MIIGGAIISRSNFGTPAPQAITRFGRTKFWTKRRTLKLGQGVTSTLNFLTTLLILITLGNEGVLGTVTSVVALGTVVILYLYGKFTHGRHRGRAMVISNTGYIIMASGLAFLPSPINVIAYVLFADIFSDFLQMVTEPIYLGFIEEEMGDNKNDGYSFVFDNELFLNVGRLIGIAGVLGIGVLFSERQGMLYGPLLAGSIQAIFLFAFFRKIKTDSLLI